MQRQSAPIQQKEETLFSQAVVRERPPLQEGRIRLRDEWPALLLFTLASLLIASPVLFSLTSRVPGPGGDNIQYVYMTGWVAKALQAGQSPFIDPHLNYPDTLSLAATDAPFLLMILVAPITWLFGAACGYNVILLLSHWLSGYFTYLWVRQITGQRTAALFAGLAFMLAPYRIVHSGGHPQLVATQMLPLFCWAFENSLRVPSNRRALLALGAATCLVGCMSQYYLIMCLLLSPAYYLLRTWPEVRRPLASIGKMAGSMMLGAALSALPYLSVLGSQTYRAYGLDQVRPYNAEILDFLLPESGTLLWHEAVSRLPAMLRLSNAEHILYLGIVVLGLAVFALRWRNSPYRRQNRVYFGMALLSALLAMGTDALLFHQAVLVNRPLWLPGVLLFQLPFVNMIRVWSRFGIFTMLFMALLAGIGIARLLAERPQWRRGIALASIGLLLLDFAPRPPEGRIATEARPRPVDVWLAQQPGDFAVASLPIMRLELQNYREMYGSLFHGKRLPAFNHPYHKTPAYEAFTMRSVGFPNPRAVNALRNMGFRYLLLVETNFDGKEGRPYWSEAEATLRQNPMLHFVTEQKGICVVEFRNTFPSG